MPISFLCAIPVSMPRHEESLLIFCVLFLVLLVFGTCFMLRGQ